MGRTKMLTMSLLKHSLSLSPVVLICVYCIFSGYFFFGFSSLGVYGLEEGMGRGVLLTRMVLKKLLSGTRPSSWRINYYYYYYYNTKPQEFSFF